MDDNAGISMQNIQWTVWIDISSHIVHVGSGYMQGRYIKDFYIENVNDISSHISSDIGGRYIFSWESGAGYMQGDISVHAGYMQGDIS